MLFSAIMHVVNLCMSETNRLLSIIHQKLSILLKSIVGMVSKETGAASVGN